jgi:tellurite resistance protein
MSFINRLTSVVLARQLPSATIPASFFAIPLGLVALGLAWQTAESIWSGTKWVSDTLTWFGAILWVFLLISYVGKWLLRRADAMAELEHPIQSCFIGLAGVVSLLASIGFSTTHWTLSLGCFCFGIAWTLIFAIYQTGRFWMGDSKPESLTPVLYLPVVAGAFVSAGACAAMGYVDWGKLAFGGGLFTWLALESVILLRLYTARPVLPPLRPAMGLQFAAPAVGAVARKYRYSGNRDGHNKVGIQQRATTAIRLAICRSRMHIAP